MEKAKLTRTLKRAGAVAVAFGAFAYWGEGVPAIAQSAPTGAFTIPGGASDIAGATLTSAVHTASTAEPVGYWAVASDGGVYNFDAISSGSMRGYYLNQPIVGTAPTPDGRGYWLVARDGGIFSFGDASFYGSMGGHPLNQPIVGMAATPDGRGYWLVARDGGIFSFGDASFYGSMGGHPLNQPVVGMAATPDGGGYWMVASDGGIFTFGDAAFLGSMGGTRLNKPVVGMAATPDGGGYWMVASDGGIFTFGDAPYEGSTGAYPGPAPIVGMASTLHGAYVPLSSPAIGQGYDISWPQCGSAYPPAGQSIDVVGSTNGRIGTFAPSGVAYGPNPCFVSEAAWAGGNLQVYQVADPINGADGNLADATKGPLSCPVVANTTACAYNWGWNNVLDAINYVHGQGRNPAKWWLDVEPDEGWDFTIPGINAQIIQGMIDAIRAEGLSPGVYSTNYQWGKITAGYPMPGVPIWIAGAGNLSTGTYSATAFCTQPSFGFASGTATMVQYGYAGSGYTGPYSPWDLDTAC